MTKECDTNTVVVFPSPGELLDRRDNLHVFDYLTKLPYVWLINDWGLTVGAYEGFQLVPSDIKNRIGNPRPFTTWLRADNDRWKMLDVESPCKLFADVFRMAFFDRIDKLVRILQELGVHKVELSASDKTKRDREANMEGTVSGGIKGGIGKIADPKIKSSSGSEWKNEVRRELKKKLNVIFSPKEKDEGRAQELINLYDFNGDMLIEQVKNGVESLESCVSAQFLETTRISFEQNLDLACKLLSEKVLAVEAKEKLKVDYESCKDVFQEFLIKIVSDERGRK